jgi:hypothetical protein
VPANGIDEGDGRRESDGVVTALAVVSNEVRI